MKLQGSGVFHPKTLQSQNCQPAENRLSLNGLEFVHGQLSNQIGLVTHRSDDAFPPVDFRLLILAVAVLEFFA